MRKQFDLVESRTGKKFHIGHTDIIKSLCGNVPVSDFTTMPMTNDLASLESCCKSCAKIYFSHKALSTHPEPYDPTDDPNLAGYFTPLKKRLD